MTAPLIDAATRARFNRLLGEEAAERVRLLNGDRERADFQASIDGKFTESFQDYCTRTSNEEAS